MQIANVGLERMGSNIARCLMKHGHEVVVFDARQGAVDALARNQTTPASSLVAEVCRRGSVIPPCLRDLTASAFAASPWFSEYRGNVADSREGRWTIEAAIEDAVPANALSAALYTRFRSPFEHSVADELLSALRAHVKPGSDQ